MQKTAKNCDVDALNQLLKGEISAVETYEQAIEKFAGKPGASDLRRIRDEHVHAVSTLKHRVTQFGGEPTTSSGTWGTFAGAVTGTAKVIGPDTVISALKKGEEHGISEYEAAIANADVNQECKVMFRSEFLPNCRRHITELEGLAKS
ncbi:DUF2383 domain-containing protein [Fimbriiglobus ruber]|uniref:DUF2383 domain-containing protein n=1 Tax=Fimbriiglobus ruber TaxID=1908690 RepID=A0A225E163_9BACT|nr:DUF2383 domain-containing protein [Fimbriiglobus ruber]OWK42107.1 hypothetical protein FRUB_04185 [Fimbriiglobus ruber]